MNGRDLALERFGDGVARPPSAIRPHTTGTPTLDEVYPLAVAAKAAGERYVDVLASGDGRAWALTVKAFGIRGLVVKRFRAPATRADFEAGRVLDGGAISQLTVRFAVIDVFAAYKRDFIRKHNPDAGRYAATRQRSRRARNVSIR